MISARHISACSGPVDVLQDVSLEVATGECIGLGGDAGSGKTTLMRILAGWVEPRSGSVHLRGEQRAADPLRLRRSVVYAAVDAIAGDGLRVDEYLRFVAYVRSPKAAREHLIAQVPHRIGLDPTMPIARLTREHRAALALAAAMVTSCNIMLLDGIVDVLTQERRDRAIKWLSEMRESGAAIVIVTAEPAVRELLCQRVVRLHHGHAVEISSALQRFADMRADTAMELH